MGHSDDQAEILEIVARQVGRSPAIAFQVVIKCRYGWPAVLANAPFSPRGEPNPNLYHLSCPYLCRQLARLEDQGGIVRLEQAAGSDAVLLADIGAAHRLHAAKWSKAARSFPFPARTDPPFIAAARRETLLKCLHAHYAFYLVYPRYSLGRLIRQDIDEEWCRDERCASYSSKRLLDRRILWD